MFHVEDQRPANIKDLRPGPVDVMTHKHLHVRTNIKHRVVTAIIRRSGSSTDCQVAHGKNPGPEVMERGGVFVLCKYSVSSLCERSTYVEVLLFISLAWY